MVMGQTMPGYYWVCKRLLLIMSTLQGSVAHETDRHKLWQEEHYSTPDLTGRAV